VRRAVALALAAIAVGCSGGGEHPRSVARATGCAAERTRLARDPMVAGAPLPTILRAPPGGRHPLLVALHGQGQNGSQFERFSRLTPRALAAGFAVAYPSTGQPGYAWQVPAEVPAARRTIDALARNACVDASRIYAVGFSAGGRMAVGLACAGAELRGYAAVSGGIPTRRSCRPAHRLDVLAIHGTHDGVVPYRGKPHARWRAVPAFVGAWAKRDGCAARPAARRTGPGVTRFTWRRCAGGHRVELVRIAGSRHGWPPDDVASIDVDATAEVVRYFAR
jgi:polyhydroxybutyrate depolymerase